MFFKTKQGLRAMTEQTIPGLMNAIGTVLRNLTTKISAAGSEVADTATSKSEPL
jgi:hypothetical protein